MIDPGVQLTPRLTAAFEMAREVHAGQTLKVSNRPYLLHLLDVCSIALRHGADEDQAIAALLHDAVEDGGGMARADEIGEAFGDRVRQIVLDCSDSVVDDPADKADWWERKIVYLDRLAGASADTAIVTGADKLSNARSIVDDLREHGDELWDRFTTGRVGSLWYYRTIAEILPDRMLSTAAAKRLGRTLRRTIDEMLDLVGRDRAELDWQAACAIESEVREHQRVQTPRSAP